MDRFTGSPPEPIALGAFRNNDRDEIMLSCTEGAIPSKTDPDDWEPCPFEGYAPVDWNGTLDFEVRCPDCGEVYEDDVRDEAAYHLMGTAARTEYDERGL